MCPLNHTAYLDRYVAHFRVYVWRGMTLNFDLGAPDYVGYAYAGKKSDIVDE